MALLTRLALHCPPRATLEPSQFKLLIDDMVSDLVAWPAYELEHAVEEWRRSAQTFLPMSGELIALMRKKRLEPGAPRPPAPKDRRLPEPERRWPYQHRPWREILAERGKDIPPIDSPIAQALDGLQRPPAWAD